MRIAIPLFDGFTALDAVGPYEVLVHLPGAEVVFVAAETGPVRTDTGVLALVADARFDEVGDCDVLVVPGGPGTRRLLGDTDLVGWVRAVAPGTTWTTSVCTGSLVLGAAGLLEGREATTHWAAVDILEGFGARYCDRRVVVDGGIVTAAGVSAGIDMALSLAALVAGEDAAEGIQLAIEYDPQPPFDRGSPAKARPETVAAVRSVIAGRIAGDRSVAHP